MKAFRSILGIMVAFILSSCMATPEIRLNAGGVEMELTQKAPIILRASISPNGKYLLTGGYKENVAKLWDISTGSQIGKFQAETDTHVGIEMPLPVAFTPDGKHVLTGGKNIRLWDLSSSKEVRTIGNSTAFSWSLSSDGREVLILTSASAAGRMILYDVNSGQEISKMSGSPFSIALSPDGKYALGGFSGGRMILWNALTGETIRRFKASESGLFSIIYSVAFSADGKKALSGDWGDGTIRLWDLFSGRELTVIKGHSGGVMSVTFSPDDKHILSGGVSDNLVKLWDTHSGSEIRSFKVHSINLMAGIGMYNAFSPDGKQIISTEGDASVRIWNASTGEEVAVLIGFINDEWLAITPEGYYNTSGKGAQYLKVKFEGKEYTVDQFYDVFYRPDIVAAKLSGQDIKGLVSLTMKDASKNPPPVVSIVSLEDTDSPKIKVCYSAKGTGGGIGEVRLFHNGKLIQSDGYYREVAKSISEKTQLASLNSRAIYADMRSLTIKTKTDANATTSKSKGDLFEDCKEIDTIPGDNEVSVTAFNSSNTVQSYMKTINFNSKAKSEEPHLYILAVGIDQYKDINVNLKYALKDARDLEEKLKIQSATLYKPQNIHYLLLTDREATKTNIVNKVNELSNTIKPQDSFILFVAGHGVLLQNQYYMLTHDYDGMVNDNSMISSNEIVEMSKKIKSLSQLFIFDTCHAGGVDYIVSGLYDARMSVLAKKMGLHIYASASDKQSAMDGYKGNGLFTYVLLDGLNNNKEADKNKDGKVTVVGLGEYSKKMTTNISKDIGHSQTPLIVNFGKDSPVYKLQ